MDRQPVCASEWGATFRLNRGGQLSNNVGSIAMQPESSSPSAARFSAITVPEMPCACQVFSPERLHESSLAVSRRSPTRSLLWEWGVEPDDR